MSKKPKNTHKTAKYKVAEISLELKEDGSTIYWVSCLGWHAAQGGMDWTYGSSGFIDLDTALSYYKRKHEEAEEYILDLLT